MSHAALPGSALSQTVMAVLYVLALVISVHCPVFDCGDEVVCS